MSRLFVVLVLVVVAVAAFGFYQGWFKFSTGGTQDKPNYTITVDKDKIEEDKKKVQGEKGEKADKAKTGSSER
ncbi:MAG TPA: hypothetical protein VKI65_04865 [Gemmataceae bacterium]|nr:hypothetical protein [Gemmataceae bacterium]